MKKGSLVVVEGLDSTGKTTLVDALAEHVHGITAVHSPSGGGELGQEIYELTERPRPMEGLTRQFLHLAAHVEIYQNTVIPALSQSAVVMDRNWCSTYAYGIAGGVLKSTPIFSADWYDTVQYPAQGQVPDLVVLCLEPHRDDRHNTPELEAAYLDLKRRLDKDPALKHVRIMPKLSKRAQLIALMQMCQEANLTRS
jgi:hypothetical protein